MWEVAHGGALSIGALSIGDRRGSMEMVRRDTHVWKICEVTDADNGSYIMISD
jgi:hypothetical protein